MNKSDIIEKIKKLLEINRANGATEAEEAAAMERANILMTKYQIEEFQIQGSIRSKNTRKEENLTDNSFCFGQFRCAVGDFFGVLSLNTSSKYIYYGAAENVDLALTMVKRGTAALSLGYINYICSEEYRKNRREASRLNVRKSFADGFYIKITQRLANLVDQRAAETKKATGTDLVVLNNENLENSFCEDFDAKLRIASIKKRRDRDDASFLAGVRQGEEFQILDEVSNNGNNYGTN